MTKGRAELRCHPLITQALLGSTNMSCKPNPFASPETHQSGILDGESRSERRANERLPRIIAIGPIVVTAVALSWLVQQYLSSRVGTLCADFLVANSGVVLLIIFNAFFSISILVPRLRHFMIFLALLPFLIWCMFLGV